MYWDNTLTSQNELFCILRPDGCIVGSSRALNTLLGHRSQPPKCRYLQDLLAPGQEYRWPRILAKLQTHSATSALLTCRTETGQFRYLQGHFTPAAPVLQGAIRATFQDITVSYQARLLARQSLRTLLEMARGTRTAIVILDHQARIRYWSSQATALFGFEREEMLCQDLHAVLAPWHDHASLELGWPSFFSAAPLDQPRRSRKIVCRRKDGTTLLAELWMSPITTHNRQYTVALFLEHRKQELNARTMEQLAYYDQLTGLPNRTLLQDRLEQALAEARRFDHPLAVLFVDLDRFKQINDTLGHAAGDQLLKIAGQRLQQCLRGNDTVARLGGDEFVVVLSGFRDKGNLPKILHKILGTLSQDYLIGDHRVVLTASIGVTVSPEDGTCADRLLRNADTAMYVAKEECGNSYQLFSHEMNHALMAQLELETHLRRALDNWEFFLLFQPRYNLATQQPVGVEALLRWRHPDGTILPPDAFLPRLEEMGLMPSLGDCILRKACEIGATWQTPDLPPLPVAVNLSCSQFVQKGLVNTVDSILSETGLPPGCLELEIDEPVLQKSAERAEGILRTIRQLGVCWSLDNFGLGYTSLQHLKTLPFDYLKIDRHFVRNLPHSQCDAAMVGAILAMARNLGLMAIAEGIENFAQHHLLLAMGCRRGQGFLFQKPCLPGALKETLLRDFDPRTSSTLVKAPLFG